MLRKRLRNKTKGSRGAEGKQGQPYAKTSSHGGPEQALTAFAASSADPWLAALPCPAHCSMQLSTFRWQKSNQTSSEN